MIDNLIKNLGNFGLQPWMVFIVLIIIVISFFYKKQIQAWLTSLIGRRKKKELKFSDLKNHDIFNTLKRVKQEVKFLKFYTDGEYDATKTRMCQDFTNFKCDICSDAFHKFIGEDLESLTYDELKTKLLNDMWQMHNDYIAEIKNHWINKNIAIEDVNYIIELFERFRFDVVVSFQNRIDAIFASSYHRTKFGKILGCYDMFAMGIDLLPKDLQTTFEALNGKFKKIKY